VLEARDGLRGVLLWDIGEGASCGEPGVAGAKGKNESDMAEGSGCAAGAREEESKKNAGWLFSAAAAATGISPEIFPSQGLELPLVLLAHHPSNSDVHATKEAECVYLISAVMQLKRVGQLIIR
jgi:hypothetical protein